MLMRGCWRLLIAIFNLLCSHLEVEWRGKREGVSRGGGWLAEAAKGPLLDPTEPEPKVRPERRSVNFLWRESLLLNKRK